MKIVVFGLFLVSAYIWYSFQANVTTAFNMQQSNNVREVHMITAEFKSTTSNGKEFEIYQFLPGTIYLKKGERVNLTIYGVHGQEHPIKIEGTEIQATIKKGEKTIIPLQFEKEGVYRIICTIHPTFESSGPMIAYIVVD